MKFSIDSKIIKLNGDNKSKESTSEVKEETSEVKTCKPVLTDKHIYQFDVNRPRPKHLWAIQNLIPFKSTNVLLGKEGNGKTFLAIDLACHLAHGLPFMGLQVKKCAVLYILGEGGFGFDNRLRAWYQYHGDIDSTGVPIYIRNIPYQFDDKGSAQECTRRVKEILANHPDVDGCAVFIDTLNRNLSNDADENSNKGMGGFVNNVINTLSCMDKVFCFALHHKNRSGGIRGHSSLAGNADNILECKYNPGKMEANLSVLKAKESETGQHYSFKAHKVALPDKDEYGNQIETLVMDFDKKLESSSNDSDGNKELSGKDKDYYDVLVKWIKVRAQAKNIEDITTVGWDVEQWNTQAKANKLFVGMKRINSAMYDARKRLENAGYIKLLKPEGDKKLTLAYVCQS